MYNGSPFLALALRPYQLSSRVGPMLGLAVTLAAVRDCETESLRTCQYQQPLPRGYNNPLQTELVKMEQPCVSERPRHVLYTAIVACRFYINHIGQPDYVVGTGMSVGLTMSANSTCTRCAWSHSGAPLHNTLNSHMRTCAYIGMG